MIKHLAWFHRWLGIVTCLVFALWFASGAVLVFKPFPSLSRTDQLRLERPVAFSAVALSPLQAMAAAGGGETLRLVQRGAVPADIVGTGAGVAAVEARNGRRLPLLDRAEAAAIATGLGGAAARASPPFDYDQ